MAEQDSNPVVLSICVCTLAGADRIRETLWSLVGQSASPRTYEIIVIENDAAAETPMRDTVDSMGEAGRRIRLVVEPQKGLSHARNRAVRESTGSYVFFIDDDALASPQLVEHYIRAITEHAPDVIGGNVEPYFLVRPPPELGYSYWSHWSLMHYGPEDRWLEAGEYFLGTNMGAARAILLQEAFDSRLGRAGAKLSGGEEWWLGEPRFRRRHVSGATVFHKVPASRMTTDYIAARSRDSRQSAALYGKSLNRDSLAAASIRQAQRIVREVGGSIVFSIKLARKLREPRERDK